MATMVMAMAAAATTYFHRGRTTVGAARPAAAVSSSVVSAGVRLCAARACAFGGGAAAYGAVACPPAAADARTLVVACSGAGERRADSIAVQALFFAQNNANLRRKHAQNDAFGHPNHRDPLVKPTHVSDACTSGPSMYEVGTVQYEEC